MAGRADGARRTAVVDGAPGPWTEGLLEHLRPAGRDIGRLLAWLAETVDGPVCLRDDTGAVLAGTPLTLDEKLVVGLVTGRLASAAWEDRGHHMRLVRVEHPRSGRAAVLAVSRREPFDREAFDIVTHTAQVVEILLCAHESTASVHRLERATSDLRLAILQLLMVEDTVSARRVAAGLWPGLLDTETACVYVVESCTEHRDRLAEACLEATGEHALVVRCPAMDGHVIVVTSHETVGGALRSLVAQHPDTFLGGSARQRLANTAAAYGQAVSALAVARFRPDKTAVYAERTHPERLMDPAALREWTHHVLRPLDALPHHTRAELLATTRLGLEFTAVSTARILGVSRNTVRARMERMEALLDTDFTDLTVRAAVQLALNTQMALTETVQGGTPDLAGHARLGGLLASPAVRSWARDLLGRLDGDARNLRRTLRTWIAAGGNAERTAQALGVHAQTVREHVRSAEPVLEHQLLAGGGDLYEVVLAHLAVGDLDQPTLGGAKTGYPDSLVHG